MSRTSEILAQLLEDETFTGSFCYGCSAKYRIPETRTDPGETCCPVDFDIEDEQCRRHARWRRIEDAIEDATADCPEEAVA